MKMLKLLLTIVLLISTCSPLAAQTPATHTEPSSAEGAAGSLYAEVPTVIVARHRDGGERVFAGCYVARKSNLRPTDVPKEEVWRIHRASVSPAAADAAIPKLLAQACRK